MPLITVGTSAVQLQAGVTACSIQLKADATNSGTIFVAPRSGVTTDATPATCGMPLGANDTFLIPSYWQKDASQVYVIASSAGQKLYYELVTGP